jgi:RES domain-containing protein
MRDSRELFRICKARYAKSAFSGEGARLYSGRWNHAGIPMVYTSTSLALAALELFVHLDPSQAPDDLVSIAATLPPNLKIETVDLATLPPALPVDWRRIDHSAPRDLGTQWAKSKRSLAFRVPSAVIADEWNVLLNPAHAAFARITVSDPRSFRYDHRMFR